MNFETVRWLFPLAVTVHNLEEARSLPAWSRQVGSWHAPVGEFEFRFAVTVLTGAAYGVTAWSAAGGKHSVGTYLTTGYMLAMGLNVLVPHVLVTVALGRPMPGVSSGVLLVLPVTAWGLRRAFEEGWVVPKRFATIAPPVVLGLLGSLPLLFRVGRVVGPAFQGKRPPPTPL